MTRRFSAAPALALASLAAVLSGCGPSNLVQGLRNPLGIGFCGLIIVVLDVLAIVEVWKSTRDDTSKLLWTVFIVIAPLVGLIAYYLFGRK